MSLRRFFRTGKDSAKKNLEAPAPLGRENRAFEDGPEATGDAGRDVQDSTEQRFSGEPGAMSATVDTLERTQVFSETDSASRRPAPVHHNSSHADGQRMSFTYASGSKPLSGYTIKRGVGVGGFGEVYFALSDAGKEVALKRVQRNLDIELRGVSHCLNLKHPNLISLYDIRYDDSGQAWIVMEYVAGKSLRDILDGAPQGLTESETRRWFAALAAGVAHLHEAGIVHRDLKPGNIFDDDGIVKIGDYGLSKYISCSRRGGHTESVGTFHYMAPEVGRGNYGREIDVYALGIILYELLTGTVPFDGESSHEIVMKHLTANPDLSGIAEPYRGVIWQALQKNPAARQQTVSQMLRPLGIELDEHGLARAASGSLSDPVVGRLVSHSDPDIQFEPQPASSTPSQSRPQAAQGYKQAAGREAGDVRFGDVQYHRPSPVPLAGTFPASARVTPNRTQNNEEPLARAVRSTAADVRRWWASLEPFPGTRLVLLVMGVILLILNTQWLLPLLTMMAIIYVPYYIIRAIVIGISRQPSYAEANQAVLARRQQPRVMTAKQWRSQRRLALAGKPSSVRAAELGSSAVSASVSSGVLATAAATVALWDRPLGAMNVVPFAWCAVVAAAAAGMVLIFAKLWEREEGSSLSRRIVMLGAGAAVGAGAFALAEFLMLPIGDGLQREIDATTLPPALYDGGVPMLAALMAHFGVLLAGLRWWKVADPLRRRRLSIWAIAVAVVGEWALHQVLPIPQPWGMLAVGLASAAVQVAAPWENPKQRFEQTVDAPQFA